LAFRVDLTDAAIADAEEFVKFLQQQKREPLAAERWWNGLIEAILSLEQMPERCPVIPEADYFFRNRAPSFVPLPSHHFSGGTSEESSYNSSYFSYSTKAVVEKQLNCL
jgi:plasmid stabilization system protein ParE